LFVPLDRPCAAWFRERLPVRGEVDVPQRVLVIEDDRFNRGLYRDLLEAEGLIVSLAATALEGLAVARSDPPALVVMDIELPGMSGLEATRQLKADPATRLVPILVISAHAMSTSSAAADGAGADVFLSKPLRFPRFQEVVRQLLVG